jgi:hypothetical protein
MFSERHVVNNFQCTSLTGEKHNTPYHCRSLWPDFICIYVNSDSFHIRPTNQYLDYHRTLRSPTFLIRITPTPVHLLAITESLLIVLPRACAAKSSFRIPDQTLTSPSNDSMEPRQRFQDLLVIGGHLELLRWRQRRLLRPLRVIHNGKIFIASRPCRAQRWRDIITTLTNEITGANINPRAMAVETPWWNDPLG